MGLKNQKIFYKIVDNQMRGYIGCVDSLNTKKLLIYYKENSFVYPTIKYSKLFVFDSFECAVHFCEVNSVVGNLAIYKAEVINPVRATYVAKNINKIYEMWFLRNGKHKFSHLCIPAPKGSVYCDAVKLLERVC